MELRAFAERFVRGRNTMDDIVDRLMKRIASAILQLSRKKEKTLAEGAGAAATAAVLESKSSGPRRSWACWSARGNIECLVAFRRNHERGLVKDDASFPVRIIHARSNAGALQRFRPSSPIEKPTSWKRFTTGVLRVGGSADTVN